MRIIVAPNCFRDGLDNCAVATAMTEGIRRVLPEAVVVQLPLADGGDNTLTTLTQILDGKTYTTRVHNPQGKLINACFAVSADGKTAIIEMAEASGLRQIAATERDPFYFSTYGTGELIRTALNQGVTRILLGAGGSGTLDVGAGALAALGAVFSDANGNSLVPTPSGLLETCSIDVTGLDPRLPETEITVLSDIFTHLKDNATVYGPQKGIRPQTAKLLDQVVHKLGIFAQQRGYSILESPWMGAGGGLAGGMAAFADAQVVGGAEFIATLAGLPEHLQGADLLITGEGRLDATSFQGKLTTTVSTMAAQKAVPSIILAGSILWEGLETFPTDMTCFSITSGPSTLEEALSMVSLRITSTVEQIMRLHVTILKRRNTSCI